MPAISIIVPVYKAEKYLSRCLDSILAQTFQDYEVILVDDGSPDRSGEICEMYAQKDTRFNVIHQPNRGVSCARMSGLKACKGLYVIQYDPDDWVESDMLGVLFQSAIENSAEVVICDYIAEKSGESVYHSQSLANSKDPILLSKLYLGQHLQCTFWNKLILRECFERYHIKFQPGLSRWEDVYVIGQLFLSYPKTAYVNRALYHYDFHTNPNSLVRMVSKKGFEDQRFVTDFFSTLLAQRTEYIQEVERLKLATKMLCFESWVLPSHDFSRLYEEQNGCWRTMGIEGFLIHLSVKFKKKWPRDIFMICKKIKHAIYGNS